MMEFETEENKKDHNCDHNYNSVEKCPVCRYVYKTLMDYDMGCPKCKEK